LNDKSLLTFQDNLSAPTSRIKKSKRANRPRLKLTHTIFLFGTLSIVWLFKEPRFTSQFCFRLQARKDWTWWTT